MKLIMYFSLCYLSIIRIAHSLNLTGVFINEEFVHAFKCNIEFIDYIKQLLLVYFTFGNS